MRRESGGRNEAAAIYQSSRRYRWMALIVRAQQASRVYRLGYLAPAAIPHLKDALFGALRDRISRLNIDMG
jgi:hypothetical protein